MDSIKADSVVWVKLGALYGWWPAIFEPLNFLPEQKPFPGLEIRVSLSTGIKRITMMFWSVIKKNLRFLRSYRVVLFNNKIMKNFKLVNFRRVTNERTVATRRRSYRFLRRPVAKNRFAAMRGSLTTTSSTSTVSGNQKMSRYFIQGICAG